MKDGPRLVEKGGKRLLDIHGRKANYCLPWLGESCPSDIAALRLIVARARRLQRIFGLNKVPKRLYAQYYFLSQ